MFFGCAGAPSFLAHGCCDQHPTQLSCFLVFSVFQSSQVPAEQLEALTIMRTDFNAPEDELIKRLALVAINDFSAFNFAFTGLSVHESYKFG